MPRIFISYRRADSEAVVGRIQERLARAFGGKNVFQDVEDIPPGVDFRQYLNSQVSSCDVELVIIGRQWASVTDASGNPRLNNPDDFVRIEVEYGLNRDSVTVIPVLVNNASMPPAEELPESLHELLFRNAIPIRNNPDFDRDMERLIYNLRAIDQRDQNVRRKAQRRTLSIVGVGTGLLAVAAIGLVASGIVKLPTGVQSTIDPIIVAQNRVQTLTAEAIAALATPTANLTGTVDAILTQFVLGTQTAIVEAYTDTPTSTYTPSNTPTESPTPTEDFRATASVQAAIDATATQIQATNDALATANAPTNTPRPTEIRTETSQPTPTLTLTATPTLEPTDSPTPTVDAMGTAYAEGTLATEGTRAVQDAQTALTQTAQAGLTPSLAPIARIIVDQDVNLRGDPNTQSGVVEVLEPWTQLVVLSTSEDGAWYYV
ncbi:MAG: TIR domain-containing protein, partial [Anaerolineae bacterium]